MDSWRTGVGCTKGVVILVIMIVIFSNFLIICLVTSKTTIKFSNFELKSVFISCEFNIHGAIAFYAFLRQLKRNH